MEQEPATSDSNVIETMTAEGDGKAPLLEDVMQLARLGEIEPVRQLFEAGQVGADYKDHEGITPLHWAAINNRYALCKFLIEAGADVNAKGGEAVATPAMWAAQRCNYYIVNLMLEHGADPLLTDAQGYNILHLATFDGNVFLLVLLLHHNIPIDTPDLQGHTSLMWAAYKGYPACVDLFLRWGANVSTTDDNGFTALHWALVKGSLGCVQKLIEYGADRFAETSEGKTPATVASEMRSVGVWQRALAECGFDTTGRTKQFPLPVSNSMLNPTFFSRFCFVYPFVALPVVIWILASYSVLIALPLSFIFVYVLQKSVQFLLNYGALHMRHLSRTPFLSGIFAATLFWVGLRWASRILASTWNSAPFLNIIFAISYSSCSYFFVVSMTEDPGYVPKAGGRSQQKAIVKELLALWKFDEQNFCVHCMIRTPLRSKHCKRCKRCIAKHDHHCPWIHNCVGANNLRHFVIYVASMQVGIIIFIRLVVTYLEHLPSPTVVECKIFNEAICKVLLRDNFTVILAVWSAFQLTWVSMLLFVQCVQIARAVTTHEQMHGIPNHPSSTSSTITAMITSGSTSMEGAQLPTNNMDSVRHEQGQHNHDHSHGRGRFAQFKTLLGLDTFMVAAQGEIDRGSSRRRSNPYSRGILTNCRDFWCDPAPLFTKRETGAAMLDGEIINYSRLYESPPRLKPGRGRRNDEESLYRSSDLGDP